MTPELVGLVTLFACDQLRATFHLCLSMFTSKVSPTTTPRVRNFMTFDLLKAVVGQRCELYFILEGKMRLYVQDGAKLIVNQLGCLYRHFGANSDGAACFLICISLSSQQKLL